MGDTDAAFADFSTLIEMDPYYTDYLCERAKISRLAGDFAGALADYDRAVQLTPPFPELYYNRGTAKAALGDVAGALADFSFVLAMEPRDLETRLSRADLLLQAGDRYRRRRGHRCRSGQRATGRPGREFLHRRLAEAAPG